MIPSASEKFPITLIERKINSAYEYEDHPIFTFKGRPASNGEKKNYRIQKGVNGNEESIYLFCSNLPHEIKVGDFVKFNGKICSVVSIGYYYNETRFVNAGIMSHDEIIKKCPKGLNIQ